MERIGKLVGLVGPTGITGQWKENHEKGNREGKLNGFEASNALAMLGIFVLNVVHLHK